MRTYEYFKIEKEGCLKITATIIGINEARRFGNELRGYINSHNGDITLDCSSLEQIETSGVAVLIEAKGLQEEKGLQLILENLGEQPKNVIRMHQAWRYLQPKKPEEIHEHQPR